MAHGTTERGIVEQFLEQTGPCIGRFVVTVTRHEGAVERHVTPNVVTADGLNHLASCAIDDNASKYNWLAIGTATHTPHINSQEIGEVSRKTAAVIGSSKEVIYAIATWGGNADGITSIDLVGAAIANHQTSGSGHFLNHTGGVSTVLGDSDFLHLEAQVQVGSHDI